MVTGTASCRRATVATTTFQLLVLLWYLQQLCTLQRSQSVDPVVLTPVKACEHRTSANSPCWDHLVEGLQIDRVQATKSMSARIHKSPCWKVLYCPACKVFHARDISAACSMAYVVEHKRLMADPDFRAAHPLVELVPPGFGRRVQ